MPWKGKPLRFLGRLKTSGSPGYSHYDWDHSRRVHQKSSTRKVIHLSTIPALGSLASEFPWDLSLEFKAPLYSGHAHILQSTIYKTKITKWSTLLYAISCSFTTEACAQQHSRSGCDPRLGLLHGNLSEPKLRSFCMAV
jgi:hypothetical protein